jgi:citrate lyase subunit beta/citryl-CoA lyase
MMAEAVCGSEAKGDARVFAREATGRTVDVATRGARLLEAGIVSLLEAALDRNHVDDVALRVEVVGALDYVIEARLEAALVTMRPETVFRLPRCVDRLPTDRDRPRRSRLYAPGNNPRLLVGIELHGADCVLLDLEDSVPPAEKAVARILVKHLLAATEFPEEVWVRINPLDAGGREDLDEVLKGRPHGICLPKAESAEGIQQLVAELVRVEASIGLDRPVWIMPILETAAGVLRCDEICSADERVVAVAFGAEDYTRDVGARRTDEALLFARSRIVAAAKAAGIQASDTVFADLEDEDGLAREAQRSRDLGFDGKGAINPRQLPILHDAFSPTQAELDAARAVVEAARQAEAEGLGAVALGGKMIDKPVLERAERLIRYAEKLTGRGGF